MERTMKLFIVCIFLGFAVNSASTFTTSQELKYLPYKWFHGLGLPYCEYKGIKLMTGSYFTDIDNCLRCSCNGGGLNCFGIGASAGVFQLGDCVAVSDNCRLVFLNKEKTDRCHIEK